MGEQVSELRVLRSAAGYYVGREYFEEEFQAWLPHSRQSGYFRTKAEAEKELAFMTTDSMAV